MSYRNHNICVSKSTFYEYNYKHKVKQKSTIKKMCQNFYYNSVIDNVNS